MYMDTCGCMHMYGASSAWGPGRALDGLHVSFPLSNHSGSEVARAKYIVLSVISGLQKVLAKLRHYVAGRQVSLPPGQSRTREADHGPRRRGDVAIEHLQLGPGRTDPGDRRRQRHEERHASGHGVV